MSDDDVTSTVTNGFAPAAKRCRWPRWEIVVRWGPEWDPNREVYWQTWTWLGAWWVLRKLRKNINPVDAEMVEEWPMVIERAWRY